uniref:Putative LRR receptor-like serine/threonine-protein kinase At2g24230 n=1 Tax=Anthurium amnicola TaxID=1678845 RepID=A0A1D1Z8M9_9ARAE
MGLASLPSLLLLALFLGRSASQQPNTDGFYVRDFLQRMGGAVPPESGEASPPVCSWAGVSCDAKGDVVTLVASGAGLSGAVPENTLGKLGKLQHLDLSGNGITALSSDFWGLGGSLRTLNLSSNGINGSLPNNVGNFGLVESLDLSHNHISGEIPVTLGSLSSLRLVNLAGNRFEGRVPDGFLGCRSLATVDLSSNRLSGSIPGGFWSAFRNLTVLNLSGNRISGKIFNFSGMESIGYLNLSGNLFQGSILGVFLGPLRVVDLSSNQFQGHIPQLALNSSFNWSALVYLDLSGNHLSGELFPSLNRARSLKHLGLASNRFSHHEFPSIEKLTKLKYLNLSGTGLTGKIPAEISQLGSLTTLDLSRNHLTGLIPHLGDQKLTVLDLSVNNLTGEIPLSLQQQLPRMLRFNFSYNNLTLCAATFSPGAYPAAFLGTPKDCPIAANPDLIRKEEKSGRGIKLALAIALSVFFLVVGLLCLAFACRRRTRLWAAKQHCYMEEPNISGPFSFQTDSTTWVADVRVATSVPVIIFEKPLLSFTFADLLSATSHFDRGTLLAEGRFGPVYSGFLPGGIHVAVKVLVRGSTASSDQEAAREFERLGRIKHPNLVPLTGYCLAGDQRIAIYEYMENGNLQNLLHDLPLGVQATDDWSTDTWEEDNDGVQSITSEGQTTWRFRHKIAVGAARALAYLHHGCFPQIVQRDVKASSIYLDEAFEPRLSDFGLAGIVGSDLEEDITRGSPGYTPPEFSHTENSSATPKSDVFGFGVVLFELVTGKKPVGDEYPEEEEPTCLVNWVRGLLKRNEGSSAIDPKIRETGSEKQMEAALRIGYLCTAELPSKRPSMQQIVGLLKDIEPVADQ